MIWDFSALPPLQAIPPALLSLAFCGAPVWPSTHTDPPSSPTVFLIPDSLPNAIAGAVYTLCQRHPTLAQNIPADTRPASQTDLASPWEYLESCRNTYGTLTAGWDFGSIASRAAFTDRARMEELLQWVERNNRTGRRRIEWICEIVELGKLPGAGSYLDLRLWASNPTQPDGRRFVIEAPARFNTMVSRLETGACVRVIGVFVPQLVLDRDFKEETAPPHTPHIGRGVEFGFTIQLRGIERQDPTPAIGKGR